MTITYANAHTKTPPDYYNYRVMNKVTRKELKKCIWVDCEAGEACRYVVDESGKWVIDGDVLATEIIKGDFELVRNAEK